MPKQQDKEYLAEEAYDDAVGLNTRVQIQEQYGSAPSWFRWVYERIALPPHLFLLDVGGGPGHLWWENRQRLPSGLRVAVCDLSPGMVQSARRNLVSLDASFSFLLADGELLPLAASSFDVVLALGIVDHLPHRAQGLAEICRVLRPGGRFYTSAGGRRHLLELQALTRPFFPEEQYGGDTERFSLEDGAQQLEPFFSNIRLHRYDDVLRFTEPGPIVAYVLSEGDMAEKLQGAQSEPFAEAVQRRLEEGELEVTVEKGLFSAERRP